MHYPIFNSIVNSVQLQLDKRGIQTSKFRKWEDNKIHAVGLELIIDLSNVSGYMKNLNINFDWDSFRETSLARNLKGMNEHPFLKNDKLKKTHVNPTIDVEMVWVFDIEKTQPRVNGLKGNYRIEQAGQWMEAISKKVNEVLSEDDIITRWHIEIEGDDQGRYLGAINLISYFQHQLNSPSSLNDLNQLVSKKLQDLLLKANKVMYVSDETLNQELAA